MRMNRATLLTVGMSVITVVWISGVVVQWASNSGNAVPLPSEYAEKKKAPSALNPCEGGVDVVFTWVNGTDPEHIASYVKWSGQAMSAAAMRRFRDYGMLRFAVRSIEKHMPWARSIVIVSNGQVPTWLDTASTRTRVVTHSQLFEKQENLPTFNSNAIEANLRNIPGLAECFLYMNDDFFLSRDTTLERHFIDPKTGKMRLYMDGFKAPEPEQMKKNIWHRSVGRMNTLINEHYRPGGDKDKKHNYAGHCGYFMRKSVLDSAALWLKSEFDATSTRRFRNEMDTALPFLAANIAIEEGLGKAEFGGNRGGGGSWTEVHSDNVDTWSYISKHRPVCVCIQDGFKESPNIQSEIDFLEKNLCSMFPEKVSSEKQADTNPCDKYKEAA